MKIDLKEISITENRLVHEADKKFEEEYMLCSDGLSLLKSIQNIERKFKIFSHFYSHVLNSFSLSILSAFRRHSNQSIMLIRPAFESSVLAIYSLYNNDENVFGEAINGNFFSENSNISEKTYKWLNEFYPDISEKIKDSKKTINTFAHSNVVIASTSFREEPNNYRMLLFDDYPDTHIKILLVCICSYISIIVDLLKQIKLDFNFFDFREEFEKEYQDFNKFLKIKINEILDMQEYKDALAKVDEFKLKKF